MIDAGAILGGYRLDRVLGRGATATVFAATRLEDGRAVALKVLAPALQANATVRSRFHEAERLQQTLRHPHVVEVYEVAESEGESFAALRLAGGGTLAALLDEGGVDAQRALAILGQVAEALDYAHDAGVAHGDVKPRNVLLDDGAALLGDFGLALALRQGTPAAAAAPGTVHYSAPERLRGEPPTPSADVYGLACVLFECLTGVVPYPHDAPAAAVGAHLYNAPPRTGEIRPGLPPALDAVLARGLAKSPGDRPGSARELIADAASVLERAGPVPAPPPRPDPAAAPAPALEDTLTEPIPLLPEAPSIEADDPGRVPRGLLVGVAVAAALAAALGAWVGLRRDSNERSVTAGPLAVTAPNSWRAAAASVLPGVALGDAAALVPRDQPRAGTFVLGTVRGVPPTYLPESLLTRLPVPPRSELVQLEHGSAYRYSRLAPRGYDRVLTVYVVPGPRRSALAACSASQTTTPTLLDCAQIARTIDTTSLDAYDPRPDPRFASAVNGAFRVLRVARNSGLASLRKARSPRAQARAAIGIAVAYRTTVSSIRRTRPPGITAAVTRGLVDALDRAGVAYTRLGESARRNDTADYDRARALIAESETSVGEALGALRDLGYGGGT